MRQRKDKRQSMSQENCRQCGICCTKGGAALHNDDILLVQEGKIPRSDCVTLRKGEFALTPVTDRIEAIQTDIIKLRGTGGQWVCCYFDASLKSCAIYENRPIACRTLKCWDPDDSLALVGKDLLSRQSVVQNEKELLELIEQYENTFPLPDFTSLSSKLKMNPEKNIQRLEELVNEDLAFRNTQVQSSAKVAAEELFLFGRPLFQLVQPFGLDIFQRGNRICLKLN